MGGRGTLLGRIPEGTLGSSTPGKKDWTVTLGAQGGLSIRSFPRTPLLWVVPPFTGEERADKTPSLDTRSVRDHLTPFLSLKKERSEWNLFDNTLVIVIRNLKKKISNEIQTRGPTVRMSAVK